MAFKPMGESTAGDQWSLQIDLGSTNIYPWKNVSLVKSTAVPGEGFMFNINRMGRILHVFSFALHTINVSAFP